jgi:hypothetical protein
MAAPGGLLSFGQDRFRPVAAIGQAESCRSAVEFGRRQAPKLASGPPELIVWLLRGQRAWLC